MTNKKIVPMGWPAQGKNMIVFPRHYYVCENDDDCWVEGCDLNGNIVRVFLRLHPLYKKSLWASKENKVPPRIADYARTARSAPKACIATPNNGPGKDREGILLFSRVFPLQNVEAYFEAGWCVLLSHDSSDPDPLFGIGRMEIDYGDPRFDSDEIKAAKRLVKTLQTRLSALDNDSDEYEALAADLEHTEDSLREICSIRFRGIQESLEDIRCVKLPGERFDFEKFRHTAISAVSVNTTTDGRYGGCIVRAISPGGNVFINRCGKMAITYRKNAIMTPEDMFLEWMQYVGRHRIVKSFSADDTVEIIPFQQINCGPRGNNLYRKPGPFKTLKRTYISPDGSMSRDCPIAIRPITAPSNGNILLGSIYALSNPIGNVLTLDNKAQSVYSIAG